LDRERAMNVCGCDVCVRERGVVQRERVEVRVTRAPGAFSRQQQLGGMARCNRRERERCDGTPAKD
jgi:hypothetical protein